MVQWYNGTMVQRYNGAKGYDQVQEKNVFLRAISVQLRG
jgi:hypothetical protein